MRAISAWPGRKTSAPPSVSASAAEDEVGDRLLQPRACPGRGPGAVEPAGLDREGAALGGQDRRAAHQRRDRGGVEGGGHHQEPQVRAERARGSPAPAPGRGRPAGCARGTRRRSGSRRRAAPGRTGSSGSGCLRSPPRCGCPAPPRRGCGSRRGRPTASPSAFGQALGGGAGGDAARLEHDDAARACRRRAGRAARGWSCRRRAAPGARRGRRGQRLGERRQHRLDRQPGQGAGSEAFSSAVRAPPGRSWCRSRCARAGRRRSAAR